MMRWPSLNSGWLCQLQPRTHTVTSWCHSRHHARVPAGLQCSDRPLLLAVSQQTTADKVWNGGSDPRDASHMDNDGWRLGLHIRREPVAPLIDWLVFGQLLSLSCPAGADFIRHRVSHATNPQRTKVSVRLGTNACKMDKKNIIN